MGYAYEYSINQSIAKQVMLIIPEILFKLPYIELYIWNLSYN